MNGVVFENRIYENEKRSPIQTGLLSINRIKNKFAILDVNGATNVLRCDIVSKDNVNIYQEFARKNEMVSKLILQAITDYLSGIVMENTVTFKLNLFSLPNENSPGRGYLIPGDKVKIIKKSPDNEWVNIGYINPLGSPLVAWVRADNMRHGDFLNHLKSE